MARKAKIDKARPIIALEQKLPEVAGRDPYTVPKQHLVKDGKGGYLVETFRRPSKTLLVNQVRQEVDRWRDSGYTKPSGVSQTSLRLLEWWFDETHIFDGGEVMRYYFAQREAIETIIYLYEVKGLRDAADLVFTHIDPRAYTDDLFATRKKIEETARDERILTRIVPETGMMAYQALPAPDHYRYAIKMATGSGKTLVMAMAVAWSYFHRRFEPESPLSKSFLIIAPNVIVFERLREDFENGTIFRGWDLVPVEWTHDWQMTFIMRGESRKSTTDGTLYLTNIQQLYEGRDPDRDVDPVSRLLGPKPKDATGSWEEDVLERVQRHEDLLVINDEAHHVHDTELQWYKVILNLHRNLKERHHGPGLSLQLDFSATPKDQNGTFFPWIVCDYPLAQAIEDRIVKAPLIVHQIDKADPEKYSRASVAYGDWINVAISRWREHFDAYGSVGKKPVLFIMAENTRDADDIYAFLKSQAGFNGEGQLLLIHTDKTGEVSKKDLSLARDAARSVDLPGNEIRAIVSVLMLREGWDVRNVSVVLGLRPFTAKANILPEQSVGRGLRLMRGIGPGYVQILEIVGTQKFEEFVRGLEVEGVGLGVTKHPPTLGVHIFPMKVKGEYDLSIPSLTPTHTREFKGLSDEVLTGLTPNPLGVGFAQEGVKRVELVETVTQKTMGQKQIVIDTGLPGANEILTHLTNRVCKEARIDGHFAIIYPIVRKYVCTIFLGEEVDLNTDLVRRLLSDHRNAREIISTLARAIGNKTIARVTCTLSPTLLHLIELDGFYWRRDWLECSKTVFNVTPCYNDFEKHFARFLDSADDITRFAKLAEEYTKFRIEYLNHKGAVSFYYPDFVAQQRLPDGSSRMWLVETKGWELPDVRLKDQRAAEWCTDATRLTGVTWQYLKIRYADYVALTNSLSTLPSYGFEALRTQLEARSDGSRLTL